MLRAGFARAWASLQQLLSVNNTVTVRVVQVNLQRPAPGTSLPTTLLLPSLVLWCPPPHPSSCPSPRLFAPLQKGEHYHIDDGQDAINNIYACGLIEEINIEPEQDMQVRGWGGAQQGFAQGFSGDCDPKTLTATTQSHICR